MPGSPRILIQFAHPYPEQSRINQRMLEAVADLGHVTVNDLFERYPGFYIDVRREQRLLLEHDVLVLHHPMYWYSAPAITKQWLDVVLEHGFAYGSKSTTRLDDKDLMVVTSTGGPEDAYRQGGLNNFSVEEFLRPFEQTAYLCRMNYRQPLLIQGAHRLKPDDIERHAQRYRELLADYPYRPGREQE